MTEVNKNRRRHHDILYYLAKILAVTGWLLFLFALSLSYYAAPEDSFGLYRYYGIEVRESWLTPLTGYLYIVLWVSALSSYFCIVIDHYRSRRSEDNKHFSLSVLILVTMSWIVYILLQFK